MTTAFENIPAGDVSKVLAQRGIASDHRVTVLVDEDIDDLARRIRKKAEARGMTDEIFDRLMSGE